MASSGWIRVIAGFRLVASEAAKQASNDAGTIVTRTTQHGFDIASNLRNVAAMQQQQQQSPSSSFQQDTSYEPPKPTTTRTTTSFQKNQNEKKSSNDLPINGLAKSNKRSQEKRNDYDDRNLIHSKTFKAMQQQQQQQQQEQEQQEGQQQQQLQEASTFLEKENEAEVIADEEKDILPENEIRSGNNETTNDTVVTPSTSTINPDIDKSKEQENDHVDDYQRLKEGRRVPSTRAGRAFGFASLGMGLAMGAVGEGWKRMTGSSSGNNNSSSNVLINDGNADRLAASLCRMRGAALKMGQMLSIQDESLLPPELTRALKQVRQGADAMPEYQLKQQLRAQLGDDWKDKFVSFDMSPFAAASIGQCHRAKLKVQHDNDDDGGSNRAEQDVVVKVQYPGVGRSIKSDLQNLAMLVKWTGLAPKGLFLDNVIRVGKEELEVECDYQLELKHQQRMKKLVGSDPYLQENKFVVPQVYSDATTTEIITTAYARGGTIDEVSHLDQEERNRIARTILYLTIQELFVWRFMQTDPNWGNFIYDVGSQTTHLIDFGASREYSKEFVDGYLRIVWASANMDERRLMEQSYKMNFLTGEENDIMLQAHKQSGYTVGEPFRTNEPFDFQGSKLSTRMGEHTSAFLKHRLTPPPSEVYTLHRKLAGAFMLCIKLGAKIQCRDLLEEVVANHIFEDGQAPPPL